MPHTHADEETEPLVSPELCRRSLQGTLCSDPQFGGREARNELETRLLRKLDNRMSILIVIFILNFIDRNSAAAARLRGFEDDLGLEGTQFASILSIFYVGYVAMQIPSNMFLSRVGKPSVYLPCCTMIWGAISLCTGFLTGYHGALLARFLLGFTEAAFFPGTLFLLNKWYKRDELSRRTAFFMSGAFISNAFGSLIASGILDVMDGVLGYAAWRWLFFIEGGSTMLVAAFALFILPDLPETKHIRWLTPAEHGLARTRMAEDSATSPSGEETWLNSLMVALADWKVWYFAFMDFLVVVSSSFSIYFPTLVSTMGYNTTITLLLCAPPWLVGAAWALWFSKHSDRTGERCMHTVVPVAITIAGFVLAMSTMNTGVRYLSFFFMVQGSTSIIFLLVWASSAVSNPPAKRPVALAIVTSVGQSGGIVGSYVWPKSWGPTYNKSFTICIMTCSICVMMCLWLRKELQRLNRKMDLVEGRGVEGRSSVGNGWRYHI